MTMNKPYYCANCGATFMKKRRPKKCWICEKPIIIRVLTEEDLK